MALENSWRTGRMDISQQREYPWMSLASTVDLPLGGLGCCQHRRRYCLSLWRQSMFLAHWLSSKSLDELVVKAPQERGPLIPVANMITPHNIYGKSLSTCIHELNTGIPRKPWKLQWITRCFGYFHGCRQWLGTLSFMRDLSILSLLHIQNPDFSIFQSLSLCMQHKKQAMYVFSIGRSWPNSFWYRVDERNTRLDMYSICTLYIPTQFHSGYLILACKYSTTSTE